MTGPRRATPLAWLLIQPIRFYQRFITPYTPASCRYYPTCSSYAVQALRTHGALKGTVLTAWRLLRCNPWSSGGIDHVPPRGGWRPEPSPDGDAPAVDGPAAAAFVTGRAAAEPDATGASSPLVAAANQAERESTLGRFVEDPPMNAQFGEPCAPIAGSTAA